MAQRLLDSARIEMTRVKPGQFQPNRHQVAIALCIWILKKLKLMRTIP